VAKFNILQEINCTANRQVQSFESHTSLSPVRYWQVFNETTNLHIDNNGLDFVRTEK